MNQAELDCDLYTRKNAEYGDMDLKMMGFMMQQIAASPPARLSEEQGIEMAMAFYAAGKIGRAISAYAQGRDPSDDTWADLVVYGMMIRERRTRP